MKSKALYAGSFDPITFGHIDIIRRAAQQFELTVLVANNSTKKYFFSLDERVRLVNMSVRPSLVGAEHVTVAALKDCNMMTTDFAFDQGITAIVRGVRNFTDYDFERMLRDVNISQQNGIETYFLTCDPKYGHVSSTAVKELFTHAGFVHEYVPLWVKQALEAKSGIQIIGVTGTIGSGKNWFCEHLMEADPNIFHLDVDKLAHFILFQSTNLPAHHAVRQQIRDAFPMQSSIMVSEYSYPLTTQERHDLGYQVFADAGKREKLNTIMYPALLTSIRRAMTGKKGVILVNAALLAEFKLTHICNNRVILVSTTEELRKQRLKERGYSEQQIQNRLKSQFTDERKRYHIDAAIERDHYGKILMVHNDENFKISSEEALAQIKGEFGIS